MAEPQTGTKRRRIKHVGRVGAPPRRMYKEDLELKLEKSEHVQRLRNFTDKPFERYIVMSIAPDFSTLSKLGLDEDFKILLERSGLEELDSFGRESHAKLVLEFFCTFEPKVANNVCEGWSFHLQNRPIYLSKSRACLNFGFEEGGRVPEYSAKERTAFWEIISGMKEYDVNCSPKCIKMGIWKYIHRFIALNINSRRDAGSRVSREDLDLMIGISRGEKIDYFQVLTNHISKSLSQDSRIKALGCTSLITRIADIERIIFPTEGLGFRELDLKAMERMKMLDYTTYEWVHEPKLPKRKSMAKEKGKKPQGDSQTSTHNVGRDSENPHIILDDSPSP